MPAKFFCPIFFLVMILTACQPATEAIPNPTVAAPTDALPTSLPPSATPTQVPSATITPTPVPSDTPLPTKTPTEVPTPTPNDLLGIWERITEEHGNEYLFFGEDGTFIYAEGGVENVKDSPSITGSFQFEAGLFTIQTEDCPEITGTYTIRLLADKFLTLERVEDACKGRVDGLTFQAFKRYQQKD